MICASIKKSTIDEVLTKLSEVPDDFDLVEIWLNEIENPEVESIVKNSKKPLLIKITEPDKDLIEKVLEKEVDYIDVDVETDDEMLGMIKSKKGSTKLIISYHDYEKTPGFKEAFEIEKKIIDRRADIAKIVFTAQKEEDNLVPARLLTNMKIPLITFCMGKLGRMSRICAFCLESVITYIAPDETWKTAEGQLTIDEWNQVREIIM